MNADQIIAHERQKQKNRDEQKQMEENIDLEFLKQNINSDDIKMLVITDDNEGSAEAVPPPPDNQTCYEEWQKQKWNEKRTAQDEWKKQFSISMLPSDIETSNSQEASGELHGEITDKDDKTHDTPYDSAEFPLKRQMTKKDDKIPDSLDTSAEFPFARQLTKKDDKIPDSLDTSAEQLFKRQLTNKDDKIPDDLDVSTEQPLKRQNTNGDKEDIIPDANSETKWLSAQERLKHPDKRVSTQEKRKRWSYREMDGTRGLNFETGDIDMNKVYGDKQREAYLKKKKISLKEKIIEEKEGEDEGEEKSVNPDDNIDAYKGGIADSLKIDSITLRQSILAKTLKINEENENESKSPVAQEKINGLEKVQEKKKSKKGGVGCFGGCCKGCEGCASSSAEDN